MFFLEVAWFFFIFFLNGGVHLIYIFFWRGGVSEFPSFRVTKFPSFQVSKGGREGGPMRGLELIMWSQGQWEASEKTAPDGAHRQTSGHGDSMTNSAQWGRVGEKENCGCLLLLFGTLCIVDYI